MRDVVDIILYPGQGNPNDITLRFTASQVGEFEPNPSSGTTNDASISNFRGADLFVIAWVVWDTFAATVTDVTISGVPLVSAGFVANGSIPILAVYSGFVSLVASDDPIIVNWDINVNSAVGGVYLAGPFSLDQAASAADTSGSSSVADSGFTAPTGALDDFALEVVATDSPFGTVDFADAHPLTAIQSGADPVAFPAYRWLAQIAAYDTLGTLDSPKPWAAAITAFKRGLAAAAGAVLEGSYAGQSSWGATNLSEPQALAGSYAGVSAWQATTLVEPINLAGVFAGQSAWNATALVEPQALAGSYASISAWVATALAETAALAGGTTGQSTWSADLTPGAPAGGAALEGSYAGQSAWAGLALVEPQALAAAFAAQSTWAADLSVSPFVPPPPPPGILGGGNRYVTPWRRRRPEPVVVGKRLMDSLVTQYGVPHGREVYFAMEREHKGPFAPGNKYDATLRRMQLAETPHPAARVAKIKAPPKR